MLQLSAQSRVFVAVEPADFRRGIASLIADERAAAGLVCVGYPFHPPGKPDRPRTEHLSGFSARTIARSSRARRCPS